MYTISVPATTANIGPGFDSLGMALNWYLEAEFSILEQDNILDMTVSGHGRDEIPATKQNIIYQAYERVFQYREEAVKGLKIHVWNNVPIARGMGSSSSAIVLGILVANKLLDRKLSDQELLELAFELEGHTDNIAAALFGGFVTTGVYDGKPYYTKTNIPGKLRCKLIIPDYKVPTSDARAVLPDMVEYKKAVENVGNTAMVVASLYSGDLDMFGNFLEDHLHQPYRANLVKGFLAIKKVAKKCGALAACISGAGPTIILFYKEGNVVDTQPIEYILKKENIVYQIEDVTLVNEGGVLN